MNFGTLLFDLSKHISIHLSRGLLKKYIFQGALASNDCVCVYFFINESRYSRPLALIRDHLQPLFLQLLGRCRLYCQCVMVIWYVGLS